MSKIITLLIRRNVCANEISLTPPHYIEMSLPIKESEWSCVLEYSNDFATFYTNLLDFVTVPTLWYFCFLFYHQYYIYIVTIKRIEGLEVEQ